MINSKLDLKEYLEADRRFYNPIGFKNKFIASITEHPLWEIRKFITFLRKLEFYMNTSKGNIFKKFLALHYEARKNRLGSRLGIEIHPNCFDKGLIIYHAGSIIVNASARIGENCKLHGDNCIGFNGKCDTSPTIGNNVDIGYGAVIIGGITISDDCVIGANAVVNHSFNESNCTIVGVPAKALKSNTISEEKHHEIFDNNTNI